MAANQDWQRCAPNDPNRCQKSGIGGQCPYLAKPGTDACQRHSGPAEMLAAQAAANMYRFEQYQQRVTEFAGHDQLKNLRGEIGILRMVLENIINQCGGDMTTLIAFSGKISDMLIKIRTLVMSCQKLDIQLGVMLDRDKVMLIGQRIVEILAAHVPNPEVLDVIGEEIVSAIMEISVVPPTK